MSGSFACSCCSGPLLRHIRASQIYWYCTHCHQEMPALTEVAYDLETACNTGALENLSSGKLLNLV